MQFFKKRQPSGSAGSSYSAVDFERLPKDTQAAVLSGIDAPGEEWDTLSNYLERHFLQASPGEQLAMLREFRRMSQKHVADVVGIRQADVSTAENNLDDAKVGTIRKIAECLGLQLTLRFVPDDAPAIEPHSEGEHAQSQCSGKPSESDGD